MCRRALGVGWRQTFVSHRTFKSLRMPSAGDQTAEEPQESDETAVLGVPSVRKDHFMPPAGSDFTTGRTVFVWCGSSLKIDGQAI